MRNYKGDMQSNHFNYSTKDNINVKPSTLVDVPICFLVLFSILFLWSLPSNAHFVKPTKDDICPVCGMNVTKNPEHVAVIMFKDGKHVKFHGAKNMFIFYFYMRKYDQKHEKTNVATMHVTDFTTLKHIRAESAFYVIGSEVEGPMGVSVLPFAQVTEAEAFSEKHGGKVYSFSEITTEVIDDIPKIIHDHPLHKTDK